jgi:hypothetical protein
LGFESKQECIPVSLSSKCRTWPKTWLDLRYFVKTKRYTGPTKKAISPDAQSFDVLTSQEKKIKEYLGS